MSVIAIIDFGSQFTQLIAKQIRKMGVYCEIFSSNIDFREMSKYSGFIFSGGPQSVNDNYSGVSEVAYKIIKFNETTNVPILGICYGQQLICHYFGARVRREFKQEFGKVKVKILKESPIIKDAWDINSEVDVLMNHIDSVETVPKGFTVIASGIVNQTIAIIVNEQRKIYCTQFHPEVRPTMNGSKLLSNFLDITNCKRDWMVKSLVEKQKRRIKNLVGEKKVVAAVSGGVDSSVAATLMYKAIGKQLNCIFIDTGLLNKSQAVAMLEGIPVNYVNKSKLFLSKLKGITNPEEKRKIVGSTFIEVLEEEAKKIGNVDFLMQGTIYSDVIESGHSSGHASIIKSHHNVGGLPEKMNLKLVEPLRYLFKDEVRMLGKEIGLSDRIIFQHPFPGPGLAVRIIGEVDEEKVRILQEVDEIYINTMRNYDLYNQIWQAFTVLLPIRTVGVMGDNRTYGYVCVLRAVTSSDGMTADVFPFEDKSQCSSIFWSFLQNVSNVIVNSVSGVNRVVYDLTSKPPATIEWE
ncbi:glutamine-hydrolyzing GMP synthase [Wolbachia endosymbiont of Dirofilaria (Dirofilaria) immitis]|uniref:glutamine-hydrolyzing GMP synthase n=1 Tax=Wolbachia endosymbiont of Dirofilaria (Dirofilaria) immitis TaxID=1812115 RepID=UPI00158B1F65|nr:glutamine-hydrolyzing GMP synthase [Wolbachia endosymbiont of Dirofilaria (Dirofilaria) immitis]QKX02000.1 glutamine-hydrolyzing GMP synthase [Wolbachia endosymbiont of Dirofilaria (Dirofilaria) immitis]